MNKSPKAPSWRSNIPPASLRGLEFIKNNPKVFRPDPTPEIRTIVFQDHFPHILGSMKCTLPGGYGEIRAQLTHDRQTLCIGAPGGIDASSVCEKMFRGLDRVEHIEFEPGSFHTDGAKSFRQMFQGCRRLKAVDVRSFHTGNADGFYQMFDGCESLTELSVSGFDTSKAYDFNWMFRNCKSLERLDLRNFRIDLAVRYGKLFDERCNAYWFRVPPHISGMFSGCESLTTLDLQSFATVNINDFSELFKNCRNLQTLQLSSSFVISEGSDTKDMFSGCEKLDTSAFQKK